MRHSLACLCGNQKPQSGASRPADEANRVRRHAAVVVGSEGNGGVQQRIEAVAAQAPPDAPGDLQGDQLVAGDLCCAVVWTMLARASLARISSEVQMTSK